jgi:tol-pal system protein YbgF
MLSALLALAPGRAFADADKTHQQIMAEIRMLQEQQQQLQQVLRGLTDTLRTLATKIDDQSGVTRKGFADQKLIVDNVAEGVRMLRQKADDTNVRLSSMTQELQTMRQTIASMPAPVAVAPMAGDPSAAGTTPPAGTAPPAGPPLGVSHQKVYDLSYADYIGGQFELAVTGFEAYIRTYPTSPLADDAQLNIGNAYYGWGRFKQAVGALQTVIQDYPQSESVAPAYYKLGQAYDLLNQPDEARKAYETLILKFPDSLDRTLAQQALERMKKRK